MGESVMQAQQPTTVFRENREAARTRTPQRGQGSRLEAHPQDRERRQCGDI